jgi:hypothetical protein
MQSNRRLQLEEEDEVDGEEVHETDGRLEWRTVGRMPTNITRRRDESRRCRWRMGSSGVVQPPTAHARCLTDCLFQISSAMPPWTRSDTTVQACHGFRCFGHHQGLNLLIAVLPHPFSSPRGVSPSPPHCIRFLCKLQVQELCFSADSMFTCYKLTAVSNGWGDQRGRLVPGGWSLCTYVWKAQACSTRRPGRWPRSLVKARGSLPAGREDDGQGRGRRGGQAERL